MRQTRRPCFGPQPQGNDRNPQVGDGLLSDDVEISSTNTASSGSNALSVAHKPIGVIVSLRVLSFDSFISGYHVIMFLTIFPARETSASTTLSQIMEFKDQRGNRIAFEKNVGLKTSCTMWGRNGVSSILTPCVRGFGTRRRPWRARSVSTTSQSLDNLAPPYPGTWDAPWGSS